MLIYSRGRYFCIITYLYKEPYRIGNDTVDGCKILRHQKDGWNPTNNGIFPIYQLVQDFATIHSITPRLLFSVEM